MFFDHKDLFSNHLKATGAGTLLLDNQQLTRIMFFLLFDVQ